MTAVVTRRAAWPQARILAFAAALSLFGCRVIPANTSAKDTTSSEVTRQGPELVSAFFGLDHANPSRADWLCPGAAGKNGMPVVFPLELDIDSLQAGDFSITTRSGQRKQAFCVSPAPALDPGELLTILLIGDYGTAEDPPISVEIVGNLLDASRSLNFKGRKVDVIALEQGPILVLSQLATAREWKNKDSAATSCPASSSQVLRVVWSGGVTRKDTEDVGETERKGYDVKVVDAAGNQRSIKPFALADLNDGDNNHDLCLDTTDRPVSVSFAAGLLVDPRGDLNPRTEIRVSPTSAKSE